MVRLIDLGLNPWSALYSNADAVPVQADVTNEDDVARMVAAAMDNWCQVDVLMSNAAIPGTDKYVWEQTRDNFIATYEVDCMAAMLCSKEVLNRSMIERRQGAALHSMWMIRTMEHGLAMHTGQFIGGREVLCYLPKADGWVTVYLPVDEP